MNSYFWMSSILWIIRLCTDYHTALTHGIQFVNTAGWFIRSKTSKNKNSILNWEAFQCSYSFFGMMKRKIRCLFHVDDFLQDRLLKHRLHGQIWTLKKTLLWWLFFNLAKSSQMFKTILYRVQGHPTQLWR